MGTETRHSPARKAWSLAASQHWVVSLAQLLGLGYSREAIRHRVRIGRLHPVFRAVYAVGRRHVDDLGLWKAATLSCGPGAVVSHSSAAALWGFARQGSQIELSTVRRAGSRPGIIVHRSSLLGPEATRELHGIPVTTPARTLVDIAPGLSLSRLEAAVSDACRLDLTDPEALRELLRSMPARRGVGILAGLLDRHTIQLTDSELERRFLPILARAGLPEPQTQRVLNGYRVDFYWPELGLVVETDGLRFHRTAADQARDRERDQAHTAAGLTQLRFTHAQVRHQPRRVIAILGRVARSLPRRASSSRGQGPG